MTVLNMIFNITNTEATYFVVTLALNFLSHNVSDLLVITVATTETDGYKRYMRSVKIYDLNAKVTQDSLKLPSRTDIH